jgi:hypothetical protein
MLKRAKRASHIDPPASSNAIMRRARPYRGENPEPGKDVTESLTPRPELENPSETSPLNLQRHATVKGESLFQQQSRTKQFNIAMWPPHELKPNRQPILSQAAGQ